VRIAAAAASARSYAGTLVLAALWAGWHAPLFFILASYGSPLILPGFFIGLTAGALVLSSLYNGTGASILAVAVWHASYNLSAGRPPRRTASSRPSPRPRQSSGP